MWKPFLDGIVQMMKEDWLKKNAQLSTNDSCTAFLMTSCPSTVPMTRPWHIRLALQRALCIVVSAEHYLSTIQHLLIIFNHMLPDRLGEGSVRTFVRVVSADITYLDEMYGESGYQMLLSTFRAPGNEPSQISAQNYLAQLLRGKSFRNIMSIFMSIFLFNHILIIVAIHLLP